MRYLSSEADLLKILALKLPDDIQMFLKALIDNMIYNFENNNLLYPVCMCLEVLHPLKPVLIETNLN